MRIVVSGDRYWTDKDFIYRVLSPFKGKDVILIHGAQRGVDTLAGEVANDYGFEVVPMPAWWGCADYTADMGEPCVYRVKNKRYHRALHGPAAGHQRNTRMLRMQPDLVICIHDQLLNRSKGTLNMKKQAEALNFEVIHRFHDGKN